MADPNLPLEMPEPSAEPTPPPSLARLAQETRVTAPRKAAPAVRGDDVMVKAQAEESFDDDEQRLIKLFRQSKEIIDTRMQEDPAYGEAVMQRLQTHEGESLINAMIDEADQIKIEFLKKEDPARFNSAEAGRAALINSATFGQLTRIMGGVGALVQGRPYSEVVEEHGEKFRLMEKAFPGSNAAGTAAGFLIPGSPARHLFEKAAGAGTKVAGKLLGRMAQNPNLLTRAAQSAIAGGAGAGAVAGVEGTLGEDLQGISFDRGAETALTAAGGGGALGATLPLAGAALSAGARSAAPAVRWAARGLRDRVARGVEQLTGTEAQALRAYNADPRALRQAAGAEADIGKNLVDFLQNHKKSPLPEVQLAKGLLPRLPEVSARDVVKFLEEIPAGSRPDIKAAREVLKRDWAPWVRQKLGSDLDRVRPEKLREVVDDLQDVVANQYGKDSPILPALLKEAGAMARQGIVSKATDSVRAVMRAGAQATPAQVESVTKALASGKLDSVKGLLKPAVPQAALDTAARSASYVSLMEKAAEKRDVLKFIGKQLGSTHEMQSRNAEGFITRLFGKNKEVVRSRLADLDAKFGTNFLELSQNSHLAAQLGPKGVPATFSNLATGKALMGTLTGGATFGPVGAAVGAVASSPKGAAVLLGMSDKATGFIRRMVASPKALEKVALGPHPLEVRRLAQEISKTLVKDGPISAAGVTRLVADTPYFVGLVHAFDLAEQKAQKSTGQRAVVRMQQTAEPTQEIATPQTDPNGGYR